MIRDGLRTAKRTTGYYAVRRKIREPRFLRHLRSTDAFLLGHPKSGNTWVALMLAHVSAGPGDPAPNTATVGLRVPYVHGRDDKIADYDHLADPRVFRNENPQYPDAYPRTIYLVRDPRSVLVSLWHMYRTLTDDRSTSLNAFVDQYLDRVGIFRRWMPHLERWDRQVDWAIGRAEADETFLLTRYEDLLDDRAGELRRIVEFLGATPPEATLAAAIDAGSFENMRASEEAFGAEALADATGSGVFVRRGEASAWHEEMEASVVTRVVDVFSRVMQRAGYET